MLLPSAGANGLGEMLAAAFPGRKHNLYLYKKIRPLPKEPRQRSGAGLNIMADLLD